MDKVLKAVQLLTLILVSWDFCWKWAYDEAKTLSKSETFVAQECMQRIKP
jgi:hypothetical protein